LAGDAHATPTTLQELLRRDDTATIGDLLDRCCAEQCHRPALMRCAGRSPTDRRCSAMFGEDQDTWSPAAWRDAARSGW
jgi:hypothetical protein